MPVRITELPNDVEQLKKLVVNLQAENAYANEQLALLRAQLFGRKSEKRASEDEGQARLFDEAESTLAQPALLDAPQSSPVRAHTRKKAGRRPLPEDLPRKEILHDIPDDEKTCGCGAALVRIGEETTEKLDVMPQRFIVERHIRPKYACKSCEGSGDPTAPAVRIAPAPPQMIPKSAATPGLLAQLFTAKFCDALPFYRQEAIYARHGVDLPRITMCNWAVQTAARAGPLLDLLKQELLAGPGLAVDETTLQVLKEKGQAAQSKSYMWVMRGGMPERPVLWFEYRPSRSAKFLADRLQDFTGWFQSDGFQSYDAIGERPGIVHVGCWAHARRGFHEAQKSNPQSEMAKEALELIGQLYELERDLKKRNASLREIRKLRRRHAQPILTDLKARLDAWSVQFPPRSKAGSAIGYALGQWPRLTAYVEDGSIRIDNNLVENAIRPFVVGRKNWLFSVTPEGAAASAALYTLIENAKANGLEPYWYLRFLFERLPHAQSEQELKALLPQAVRPEDLDGP